MTAPVEQFQAAREHLLEHMLEQERLERAREMKRTAEALILLHQRAVAASDARLAAVYTELGKYEITRPIDLSTGMGERRLVSPPAPTTPAPASNGDAAAVLAQAALLADAPRG